MSKRFAIGLAISGVLLLALYLHYRTQVSFDDLVDSFRGANLGLLAAVLVFHLVVLSLKAVRWNVVLESVPHEHGLPRTNTAEDPPARWLVFDALFLGYFGNYVLPAKLGELGRSLLYSRRARVPFPSVIATIVFERFLDALTLIVFFYITLMFLPATLPDWVGEGAQILTVASIGGLIVLWFLWLRLPRDGNADGLMGKVAGIAAKFREGLGVMQQRSVAGKAAGWTAVIWALECWSVWICIRAFGFEAEGLWTAAVLQTVISSFAIAAPTAPAGLGIHQWVSVLIMSEVFGVPKDDALAISLIVTGAVIFWTVPLGLFGLARQGASLAELQGDVAAVEDSQA
ncbi:MAG: flippase-like domain-containing protein [Proteobacteria bacterium]|nr:flippase-like domain-containing protein [Pseudomonadota bacterium]